MLNAYFSSLGIGFLCFPLIYINGFSNPCKDGFVPFPNTRTIASNSSFECVSDWDAFTDAMTFLGNNLPNFDEINRISLGFQEQNTEYVVATENFDRVASYGVNSSLITRTQYKWAALVDKEMFFEFVTPYGSVNEGRSNWRELMVSATSSILSSSSDNMSIPDAVALINENLWKAGVLGTSDVEIVFKSSQTPLIYDPMSVVAFGYGSCTGVSIVLIDALRSAGIPARLAGTPAWNGVKENGNHNWVEVFSDVTHQWEFIEAQPAGAGESLSDPCDKWFCTPSNFANGTEVYAARWVQSDRIRYPMAWDMQNEAIPGIDRTEYYQEVCNKC